MGFFANAQCLLPESMTNYEAIIQPSQVVPALFAWLGSIDLYKT